eukprot:NODE_3019_length_953_cov_98.308717_g2999_i0.p1 GENE.NODE_3019_length_953_cov_98.308717_g2999_i0~~NODE_3019_length_953_cov_98.308717_g2999_i0.p1  ORF type:complete len:300 (-),score=87.26 NODE_3019_length_953_cov_98.308717_g2999_i0:52-885(-)
MGCCYTIPTSEVAIVERFGKFAGTSEPGFHFINPLTSTIAGRMTLRVQELQVHVETKTKDNVFVNVVLTIQYKALQTQMYKAFYELTNSEAQLQSYVFNNVRAQIPHYELDQLFAAKDEIAKQLKDDLEHDMNQFGWTILQALITDLEPDALVKKAMNDINAAQRLRVAAQDKAEAEKIAVVKGAEAEAESKRLSGVGLAEQRKAVVLGLHESIRMFSEHTDIRQNDVMELLLMNQYFDTLKEMTANTRTTTVFVPNKEGGGSITDQTRDGMLQARQ